MYNGDTRVRAGLPPPQVSHLKPLKLLYRAEWSAAPPKFSVPLELPVEKVFMAPTNRPGCFTHRTCSAELQRMQNFHMKVDTIPDIRFNFVITTSGLVYEGRGWREMPDLPKTYAPVKHKSLFIGLIGDYKDPKTPVPHAMLEALDTLLKIGVSYKYIIPDYDAFDI